MPIHVVVREMNRGGVEFGDQKIYSTCKADMEICTRAAGGVRGSHYNYFGRCRFKNRNTSFRSKEKRGTKGKKEKEKERKRKRRPFQESQATCNTPSPPGRQHLRKVNILTSGVPVIYALLRFCKLL